MSLEVVEAEAVLRAHHATQVMKVITAILRARAPPPPTQARTNWTALSTVSMAALSVVRRGRARACHATRDTNCQNASSCTASTDSSKDGSDGNFYCINGGTVGGTTGSCTCTIMWIEDCTFVEEISVGCRRTNRRMGK